MSQWVIHDRCPSTRKVADPISIRPGKKNNNNPAVIVPGSAAIIVSTNKMLR